MTDPRTPAQQPPTPAPRRHPWWVEIAVLVGWMWIMAIFMLGTADWSRDLTAQLSAWGIPGGDKTGIGKVSFFPVLFGMLGFWGPLNRAAYDAALRSFAVGVLWGAAYFLTDPAARILFHLAVPGFAATENASLVRTGLDILVMMGWSYFGLFLGLRALMGKPGTAPRPDEEAKP
ncbi:MAG: hypothetical protein IMF08_07100, partial [Proteobacteria bacterium]|nr:hypothetical protein [Pseudomonadota bacterium]